VPGSYIFAFQLTIYINFLNHARRPQDALRQGRDGVKEDMVMCKKLIYLVSFILVLGLASSASAELIG